MTTFRHPNTMRAEYARRVFLVLVGDRLVRAVLSDRSPMTSDGECVIETRDLDVLDRLDTTDTEWRVEVGNRTTVVFPDLWFRHVLGAFARAA